MKKNIFLKSACILLIGSVLTRTLGFLIRIVFTRVIGEYGINLYSLIMPTYSLIISLTQLGLPMAISTIVARNKTRGKTVVLSIVPIILLLNIIMMSIIVVSSKFIAVNLLDEPNARLPIIAMAASLPFISISSILRGYFFGKQRMLPHTISNIIEQIVRLCIIILFLPRLVNQNPIYGVCGFILLSIISEITSIIVFLLFTPRGFKLYLNDLKPDLSITKEILSLCLPTVGGRIYGNIFYFFEPVILTYILKYVGYTNEFIQSEYGIYNAYVLPLLIIPSFIVQAISTALIPEVSKSYERKDNKNIRRRLKQSLKISLILGLITNIFVFLFPSFLLKLIYNTNKGITYIRVLSFFFIIYNLEAPLSSTLQALGKTKESMSATTIGVTVKTLSIAIFSLFKIGIYGLVIGEILDILLVVSINYYNVKKVICYN